MNQTGLTRECSNLQVIIDDLSSGKETCEIGDTRYTLDDAIDYLRGFLQELIALDAEIAKQGNTPAMLEEVHKKYTELWLFQLSFTVASLPRVIRGLLYYPNSEE